MTTGPSNASWKKKNEAAWQSCQRYSGDPACLGLVARVELRARMAAAVVERSTNTHAGA